MITPTMPKRKHKRRPYRYYGRPLEFAPKVTPAHKHKLVLYTIQSFGAWIKVWRCEDPNCDYEQAIDMEVGP